MYTYIYIYVCVCGSSHLSLKLVPYESSSPTGRTPFFFQNYQKGPELDTLKYKDHLLEEDQVQNEEAVCCLPRLSDQLDLAGQADQAALDAMPAMWRPLADHAPEGPQAEQETHTMGSMELHQEWSAMAIQDLPGGPVGTSSRPSRRTKAEAHQEGETQCASEGNSRALE